MDFKGSLLFLILIFCYYFIFAQAAKETNKEPINLISGLSTYKWDIKKWILEYTNNIGPVIVQGESMLKANMMIYNENTEVGFAYGNVYYENKKDRNILTSEEGTYNGKIKEIIANKNPVIIMQNDNTVAKSDIIKIYPNKDLTYLIGNVWITNSNNIILGEQAILNQKTGKFNIIGNAKSIQKDSVLTADKIDIYSTNKQLASYTATGHVVLNDKVQGYIINSGRLDYYKELGYSKISINPVITFTSNNITAYSIVMEKYDKEDKANLLGNVIIIQNNKKAFSKWGEYYTKTKKMYLTGNPILVEGNTKFAAQKIMVDIEAGTMSMIGKGIGFYQYKK